MPHHEDWKLRLISHLPQHGFSATESCTLLASITMAFDSSGLEDEQRYACIRNILDVFAAQRTDLKKLATNPAYKKAHFVDDYLNADVLMINLRNKMKHHLKAMPIELVADLLAILSPKLDTTDNFSLSDTLKKAMQPRVTIKAHIQEKAPPSALVTAVVIVAIFLKQAVQEGFADTAKLMKSLLSHLLQALGSARPSLNPSKRNLSEFGGFGQSADSFNRPGRKEQYETHEGSVSAA